MKSTETKIFNKFLNIEINNFLWLFLLRRICRLNKIYFNLSDKKKLPENIHPLSSLNTLFEAQYSNYIQKMKKFNLDIYNTFKKYFKKNSKIRLLDYGGENLDLYLFLKDKYPNIKIIVVNQLKLVNFLKRTRWSDRCIFEILNLLFCPCSNLQTLFLGHHTLL